LDLSNKSNIQLFLPSTQDSKRTAGLTLRKLSVDRCSYVLVTWKMTFNVIKQTVWNRSRITNTFKYHSWEIFDVLKRNVLKIKLCFMYIQEVLSYIIYIHTIKLLFIKKGLIIIKMVYIANINFYPVIMNYNLCYV